MSGKRLQIAARITARLLLAIFIESSCTPALSYSRGPAARRGEPRESPTRFRKAETRAAGASSQQSRCAGAPHARREGTAVPHRGFSHCCNHGGATMLGTILLVILILLLLGALPAWPHSRSWGYYPSGGLGLILLIVIIVLLLGRA
jgi:hypothetical protein